MDAPFSEEQERLRRTIRRDLQKECSHGREKELDDSETFSPAFRRQRKDLKS